MVGCNAPMLESVVISVGSVPQSWCVSFPDRISPGISGRVRTVLVFLSALFGSLD